jgi:cystathionine beta-lyase/cystathionine gamma-synthase
VASEATSLDGVETLVSTPFNSSHFSLTPEQQRAARIDDGMIADLVAGLDATR